MNELRRLAAKTDQHMQQLATHGVNAAHAIINRMMAYVPDLHKLGSEPPTSSSWHCPTNSPGFYRYALIMEEASEAERNKASRPYGGMAECSEEHKQLVTQLLTTAATLERGYQAFLGSGNLQIFQPQVNELDKLHRQWLANLESFKSSLRAQGAEPMALEYVDEAFGRLAERIKQLAG